MKLVRILGDEKKLAIVLTKCDNLTPEEALLAESRVCWGLSKLLNNWLAPNVFLGSFLENAIVAESGKEQLDEVRGCITIA